MDQTLHDLKNFASSFFTHLGCTLRWDGLALQVSSVPPDFEEAYGKKGPYTLMFDGREGTGELVSRGSFLLKTMTSYLEQRGQTALVKLVFDHAYLAAFKRSFSFKKCELLSLTKTPTYHLIYLFSFSTTLQYLNEKEQVMNTIALHKGAVIPFTLDQYAHEQGNPRDVTMVGAKESYVLAKETLKQRLETRIQEISAVLDQKTIHETARIREHYDHQLQERAESVRKLKEQLATLEKIPSLSPTMVQRRDRLLEQLKLVEDSDFETKIIQERDFCIRDEEGKHALNVSNKLVSTTLVYYPIFTFQLTLKNADVARTLSVLYNPLKNDFEAPVTCEQCTSTIRELFLCSSAHVVCVNCFDQCRTCERGMCALCMKKTCAQCARKLCKRCVGRCTLCWKDVCKTHLRINYASGSEGCTSCLGACSRCGVFADKAHRSRENDGSEICLKCAKLARISFS